MIQTSVDVFSKELEILEGRGVVEESPSHAMYAAASEIPSVRSVRTEHSPAPTPGLHREEVEESQEETPVYSIQDMDLVSLESEDVVDSDE